MKALSKAWNAVTGKKSSSSRGAGLIQVPHRNNSSIAEVIKASDAIRSTLYNYLGCAIPRHDPFELQAYADSNGYHSAALHLKVATTVGVGYNCSPALHAAIDRANFRQTFQDILNEWALDMETFGNAFILPYQSGGRVGFYRLPAMLTRIKLPVKQGDAIKYLQYAYTAPSISQVGFGWTEYDAFEPGMQMGVRQMSFGSPVGDPWYGEPEYCSVKKLLKLNSSIVDYAEKFFDQALMQDMAIILKGVDMDPEEQDKIKSYLTSNFRGNANAHKILFLTLQTGEEVDFHEFNKELLTDSFSNFRHDNRDEIISANRVPPRMVSVLAAGSLGGTGEVEGQLKTYKQAFNDPRQMQYDGQWQQLFRDLGLPDADSFKLRRLDVTAGVTDMQTLVQGLMAGILTRDEARADWQDLEKRDPAAAAQHLIQKMRSRRGLLGPGGYNG